MTGFGKSVAELPGKKVTVEIRALNSKQFDLTTHVPPACKEMEMPVRSLLLSALERGKIDLFIQIEYSGEEIPSRINRTAIEGYYRQIVATAEHLHIAPPADWFQVFVRLPDVVKTEIAETDASEWETVMQNIRFAVEQLCDFRIQEGRMLQNLFAKKIGNISALLAEIEKYEAGRIEKIKARLAENLEKTAAMDYDKVRFEQEMFYYIEKLDVNEEKNRLQNHLQYFLRTMESGKGQGKKLGFIAQEIGREINTLGSKSYHAEMQQLVVQMKDELEQIKEQLLNVL
jgi:uncharacterized protein (TIGR00255 family)